MDTRTPLLVDTSTTFEKYISRLSKTDKKKYKANLKQTTDCSFKQIPYSPKLMRDFVSLWETQPIYGSTLHQWNVSMEAMDAIDTLVMFSVTRNDQVVAIHFIEVCDDLGFAHPPLYDKKNPELARFSWFHTIQWCCENNISFLDMGGGFHNSWSSLIKLRRHEDLYRLKYKWSYVPEDVKQNPDSQKHYFLHICPCGWKQLDERDKVECKGHYKRIKVI